MYEGALIEVVGVGHCSNNLTRRNREKIEVTLYVAICIETILCKQLNCSIYIVEMSASLPNNKVACRETFFVLETAISSTLVSQLEKR